MKKVINEPLKFVDEVIDGITCAYGDRLKTLDNDRRVILNNTPVAKGKVGIVTGGGSGHLPVFLGYVGQGMLDGCAVGNVFASPSSETMLEMIKACDDGSGVLCLYGNYGGDNMNFDMACELADFEGIDTIRVQVKDDVASSPKETSDKRRGVAGMVYAFKIAGAAAAKMMNLQQVAEIASEALECTRTMGVALSPCIVPEAGKPTFSIADDEIEIGMGIHGEPGIEVKKMMSANEVADIIMERLLSDISIEPGSEVSVMINGLGATPLEELLIVYRRVHEILKAKGIEVYMPHIGEFATSMEMAGLSVTILKLNTVLKELLRAPASTPFYTNENK